jgi:hypothetical protein
LLDQLGEDEAIVPYQPGFCLISQYPENPSPQTIIPVEAPEHRLASPQVLRPCLN